MQWECSRSSSCHTVSGATPVYWGQQGAALQCLPSFSILQLHEPSASLRSHVQTSLITSNTGKHTGENLPPPPNEFCVQLNGETESAAALINGSCMGVLKWAHSAGEHGAACVFSRHLSIGSGTHACWLTLPQHPELAQTTRGKLVLLVISAPTWIFLLFFFFFFETPFQKAAAAGWVETS